MITAPIRRAVCWHFFKSEPVGLIQRPHREGDVFLRYAVLRRCIFCYHLKGDDE